MRILALDLGTKTGWALWNGVTRTFGTVDLLPDAERRKEKHDKKSLRAKDPRPRRLREFIERANPDVIVFEDVQFASTQLQAQLWGSLKGVVFTFDPPVKLVDVPVGTLKKFATGSGAAKKDGMARALWLKEPGNWAPHAAGAESLVQHAPGSPDHGREVDDNCIDAIWLLRFYASRGGKTLVEVFIEEPLK